VDIYPSPPRLAGSLTQVYSVYMCVRERESACGRERARVIAREKVCVREGVPLVLI